MRDALSKPQGSNCGSFRSRFLRRYYKKKATSNTEFKAAFVLQIDNFRLGIFVGAKATGANVFAGFFSVDLDFHLVNVGAESALGMAVGVTHVVTAYFAFAANNAYSAHLYTPPRA